MGIGDSRRKRQDQTVQLSRVDNLSTRPMVLVVGSGKPDEQRIPLKDKPLVIGFSEECDVVVNDPSVSRAHCKVTPSKLGAELEDLESKNGTYVGAHRVTKTFLYDGINVTLGDSQFFITSDTEDYGDIKNAPNQFGKAVGHSPSMRRLFALLKRVSATDVTVMILGETGTGKDVLARAIHKASARSDKPFEIFDAGAVSPSLIESKLFGHVKGAFTGADKDHKGAFESANKGTLFLDEIGELGLDLQPKLLRAMEEQTFAKVGDTQRQKFDARIISATHKELVLEIQEGRFREDLYYRLGVVFVRVPPLRERREDISLLAKRFAEAVDSKIVFTDEAISLLEKHDWPGNVRELKNVVLGAVAVSESKALEPRDFFTLSDVKKRASTLDGLPLGGRSLESIEKAAIEQTLSRLKGNKTKTAKALGIATSTLYEKLKKYELG